MSPKNQPNSSRRDWFKWSSEAPSEPTNTLVLTSAENRFVDIRVFKDAPNQPQIGGTAQSLRPLSQLDWAFAGESYSKPTDGAQTHSIWKHFVDNRTTDAESVKDEGEMVPTLGGKTIERGTMINPATGQMTAYEECWAPVIPISTVEEGGIECMVLVMQDDSVGERGMVVRVGQYVQGVVRGGEAFALERWKWTSEDGWKKEVRMGDLFLPCGVVMDERGVEVGGEVKYKDSVWRCVESGRW